MKRMAAVLAALGISGAALATDSSDLTRMEEQSYESIASGEAIPEGESAYGYSMSDPYTDAYSDEEYVVVEEYIVEPSDTLVLIPLDQEDSSDVPG
jgi:hypothetical protein